MTSKEFSLKIENIVKEKIKLEATNLKMLKFPKCGQLPV